MLGRARLDVAYPGVWLADGVYATHGHYLDRHVTIPSFERLAAGALGRVLGDRVDDISCPDDYEIVLAPIYALLDAIAARAPDGRGPSHANASTRAWRALTGDGRRPVRRALLAGAFPLGIARAQPRSGSGRCGPTCPGVELRRAGLRAIRATSSPRLRIDARHVIFGHTHRAGPLAEDDAADWALPAGGGLVNAGCWVSTRMDARRDRAARTGRAAPWRSTATACRATCACWTTCRPRGSSRRRGNRAYAPGGASPGAKQTARHSTPVAGLEVEHALRAHRMRHDLVGARVLDRDRPAVDADLAVPVEHRPHRPRDVRAAPRPGQVRRSARRSAPPGRPRAASGRAARARSRAAPGSRSSVSS